MKVRYYKICYARTTDKAWCFQLECLHPRPKIVFVPKNICEVDTVNEIFEVPDDFAEKKGLKPCNNTNIQ